MRGNKKGPENMGPKTGRGLGYCSGSDTPGYMSDEAPQGMGRGLGRGMGPAFGRGMGRGMGRGAGRFGQNFANPYDSGEISDIKTRLDSIEQMLKNLKK
jgi:hypothetical protein